MAGEEQQAMQLSPALRAWLAEYQRGVYLYDLERDAFRALDYDTFSEYQALCDTYDMDTVADALGESEQEGGGDGG